MWRRWSKLSVARPFQQSGKVTCSWSFDAGGHDGGLLASAVIVGGAASRRIGPYSAVLTIAQSQKTMRGLCGPAAREFPATIVSASGYGRTGAVVSRR